jgi:hypothetical protein
LISENGAGTAVRLGFNLLVEIEIMAHIPMSS